MTLSTYVQPASFALIRSDEALDPYDILDVLGDVAAAFEGALDAMSFALEYLIDDLSPAQKMRQRVVDAILDFQLAAGLE